jgi:hypothetical protein
MKSLKEWLALHRAKKDLKNLRNEYRLHEDLLPAATREALEVRFQDTVQAIRGREMEDLKGVVATWRRVTWADWSKSSRFHPVI